MRQIGRSIANLECGNVSSIKDRNDKLEELQNVLQTKLIFFITKLISCDFAKSESKILAPFYARNILETASTALLARFDSFRLIVTYNVQNDSTYKIDTQSNVAIKWSQDIIAPAPPTRGLWHFENKYVDFNRALLSKYQGEIIWKPAFLRAVDYLTDRDLHTDWVDELIASDENEFFERSRVQAQSFFSSFSKGVHSENLVDISMIYDEVTLRTLSLDLLKWCSTLGFISHFSSYSLLLYSSRAALNYFKQSERMVIDALR